MNAVLKSYPAYDIVECTKREGYPLLKAGCSYAVKSKKGERYTLVYANSVVSYALESGEDPIKAYDNAILRNHETHWLNLEATSLTSHKRDRRAYEALEVGVIVLFEGRLFEIAPAPNGNFKLVQTGG